MPRHREGRGLRPAAFCLLAYRATYGQIPLGSSVTALLLVQVLAVPDVPEPDESSSQARLPFPDAVLLRIWFPLVNDPKKDAIPRREGSYAVVPQRVVSSRDSSEVLCRDIDPATLRVGDSVAHHVHVRGGTSISQRVPGQRSCESA